MKVKALCDHFNDYRTDGGPGVAVGDMRAKSKGDEYEIPDDLAKHLIDDGTVEEIKKGADEA